MASMATACFNGAGSASAGGSPSDRPPLLMLCHRLPYPPNKGDKIRSWHLLAYLARHYRVFLGAFVDDPDDWQYVAAVRRQCEDTCILPLATAAGRCRSLLALPAGRSLSVAHYRSAAMGRWAARCCAVHGIHRRFVFSSTMGQFLPPASGSDRTVIDFVDVDSDKWRQYAEGRSGAAAWIYGLEARRLADFEVRLAGESDAALFVSEAESAFFRSYPGVPAERCGALSNGVDTAYFDPAKVPAISAAAPELVFTGAMDYWPNIDAVVFFAREVMPELRAVCPELRFTIVGGKPTPEVQALASLPGVTVTGRVPDVRPYLAWATAAVAPMRVARGVQNKVLEAMAMARPVLVSSMGLEGIDARDGEEVLVADRPADYRRHLAALLDASPDHGEEHGAEIGSRARALVMSSYSWESCLAPVRRLLEGEAPVAGND